MPGVDEWMSHPVTISRDNAAKAIFTDLRTAIEQSELPVGVRLPAEAALARRYGVSRPVVREALRSTQALGLTTTKTGSGTYVTAATASPSYGSYSAEELIEARPHIEIPAARWAAARRTPAQLTELSELCASMDSEIDPQAWVDLDARFHSSIAGASGNRVLAKAVADTRGELSIQSQLLNLIAHRREPSNAEHRAILEAIALGDADGAAAAMTAHLDEVAAVLRALIRLD